MQMRGEHDVDRVGGDAGCRERMRQVDVALETIDVRLFLRHLVARARIDQHRSRTAHQQTPHRHADPVPFIGRRLRLPERFGNHAEHRAAVQVEKAVRHRDDLDVSEGIVFGRSA